MPSLSLLSLHYEPGKLDAYLAPDARQCIIPDLRQDSKPIRQHFPFMTRLMTLSWRLLLRLVPEKAWARRLKGVVQTTAFGPLRYELLSREEKHLDQT